MAFLEKLLRSKVVVWTLIVLPGLWPLVPLFVTHNATVGTDPVKYILHHLGFVACLLLATVLTFTPLRVLFPKSKLALALNRHRRLVGVSAFAYAALHLTAHLFYEGGLVIGGYLEGKQGLGEAARLSGQRVLAILTSDVKKPFLLIGLIAFSILLVLAVTSLHAFVRWLGGRRWKTLHRLTYVAAALAAYHQAIARKIFPMQVVWIFGPLVLLEIARVIRQAANRRKTGQGGAAVKSRPTSAA